MISELSARSRGIFKQIVDTYMATGEPVGSRTISRSLSMPLSAATVRNVMADLEELGLLYAPHTSAGRLPTEAGLKLYVDGLLEVGNLTSDEKKTLEANCISSGKSLESLLQEVTTTLSGLSGCASLVAAPKTEYALKHIEFVNLSPGRALVVLVTENGIAENRVISVPADLSPSALVRAGNFLSARLVGRTLDEVRATIVQDLEAARSELDALTKRVVETGLATWTGPDDDPSLIVRGQSKLLNDVVALSELERIRSLFDTLETRESVIRLVDLVDNADGVQIFIGSHSPLFEVAGCSLVVAPFRDSQQHVVGAIGVIGPHRINYARVIPMVDFTSRLVSRFLG